MSNLTKHDLALAVADAANIQNKQAEEILETVFAEMAKALASGRDIEVRGFGKWRVIERAARTGRNPRTGESIPVAPKKAIGFKAYPQLKDAVNKQQQQAAA